MRYLAQQKYPEHKSIIMCNIQFHPLIADFVSYTIDLPKQFYDLGLEADCYESPPPNSIPGSYTPPEIWAFLVQYVRQFYNVEKAIELWTPRGYNTVVDNFPQTFVSYEYPEIKSDKPFIVVFPRARSRASNRNVPAFVWKETVDALVNSNKFTMVLSGTPSGAALADYKGDNVINLINYSESDKLEKTIGYVCNSIMTLSSQSGPTHLSLLCNKPTYIIGHEKERHCVTDNRFNVPTSFRFVNDYRAIDANTIIGDIESFLTALIQAKVIDQSKLSPDYEAVMAENVNSFNEVVKARQGE